MSCAICVILHISSVRKPMQVAEKGPKMQQLSHPRPIDFTQDNQDHEVEISPLPLSKGQSWLLELLVVSVSLQTMAQPHHKQSLSLYPWSGTAGVTSWIGPATSRLPDPFHGKLQF